MSPTPTPAPSSPTASSTIAAITTLVFDIALLASVTVLGLKHAIPDVALAGLIGAIAGVSVASGQAPIARGLMKLRAPKKF